jgi:hypothetical protein
MPAMPKSEGIGAYMMVSGHLVGLTWWSESLDGHVVEEGFATVRLPAQHLCGGRLSTSDHGAHGMLPGRSVCIVVRRWTMLGAT